MEFRTERLVLRPAREDDLAAMHAVLSHPKAMAYWSSAPHETSSIRHATGLRR